MPDLPLYDLRFMLKACADKPYRDRTRATARTLVRFLTENDLLAPPAAKSVRAAKDDLCIMESDLTAEGRRLFSGPTLDKWLASIERRGRHDDDDGYLRKALSRMRGE